MRAARYGAATVTAEDDEKRLEQFLIRGSETGSYCVAEQKLTPEHATATLRYLERAGERAVALIATVSESGRAPRNDPAIFALALAASSPNDATRRAALNALPRVCRTGAHLFRFAEFVSERRGWGRGLRDAVACWYEGQSERHLAYQAVKYRPREGWNHRDLLRLAHPRPGSETRRTLYHWISQGWPGVGAEPHPDEALRIVWAYERAHQAATAAEVATLARDHRLPREAVPLHWLNYREVWEALLPDMSLTSLLRSLPTLARLGLLEDRATVVQVAEALTDPGKLRASRLHPITVFSAFRVYAQGYADWGQNVWYPLPALMDALDKTFRLALNNVESVGRRWVLGINVLGGTESGRVPGMPGLTPREIAAVMTLVGATVEAQVEVVTCEGERLQLPPSFGLDGVEDLLETIVGTEGDAAQPIFWALQNKVEADVFVVYIDRAPVPGPQHAVEMLRQYRERTGIPAKLAVVGMTGVPFSLADPDDDGTLDVIGFDAAVPFLIADFAR